MRKLSLIFLFALILSSRATAQNSQIEPQSRIPNKEAIVGIWALAPLQSGIANVVEYTADGKSRLYPFNCRKKSTEDMIESDFSILDKGSKIRIDQKENSFDLDVIHFRKIAMQLSMDVGEEKLKLVYFRRAEIAPLCRLYTAPIQDPDKGKPYKAIDFVSDPYIPVSANIDRYVGKWAGENGAVQIEIKDEGNGKYRLHNDTNKNWNYLFNDVSWVSAELHYQQFAYTEKKELFTHSFHKSTTKCIISPNEASDKLNHSFFINAKRYDYVLTRE